MLLKIEKSRENYQERSWVWLVHVSTLLLERLSDLSNSGEFKRQTAAEIAV